ncbi:SDR family oxidoreductase [Clostridium sp. C8-1-8]|uniref:SDR family oxidoreductase n=1 Tax=Clostridium sp. C8-1-8 TaxID=2698831 RepID=UPI001371CA51|nr:SDR family oxidoreductase [Clostridium sp. C8-1-8]
MILYYPYMGQKVQCKQVPITFPPQHQPVQPGLEYLMHPRPIFDNPDYVGSCKLKDKVAIITGGDSGIGRAVALAFAKEGADIAIVYFNEHEDANEIKTIIESKGRRCILIPGDLREEAFSRDIVNITLDKLGHIDILVNNAGVQFPQQSILDISAQQLDDTFRTNIYSMFYLTKAVLPHLSSGSTIINTTSVTAYAGNKELIDYSSTKGAIASFTRSLALSLVDKGIRVNGVAPGPFWTPLQPSSWSADHITSFGLDTPMKRAGQPVELGPTYVYLASEDSTYTTGQIVHVDGGQFVGS